LNTARKTVDLAHKTLLAGVGAYDSGREKAANKFDQLFIDGSAYVNALLEKGESLETQIQAKLKVRSMLQSKISALSAFKAKLGFGNESRDQKIDMLSQRVDSLIDVVAKLAQQDASVKKTTTTAKPIKKAIAKPSAAKPASVKPAVVKPAAVKPVAVKPAAVKPVAVKPAAVKPAAVKPVAVKPAAVKSATAKTVAVKAAADKKD
jgi:hypothetical protein